LIRDLALLLGIIFFHVLALIWLARVTQLQVMIPVGQSVTLVDFDVKRTKTIPETVTELKPQDLNPSKPRKVSAQSDGPDAPAQAKSPPPVEKDVEDFRVMDSEGRLWIPQKALDEFLGGAENKEFEIGRSGQNDMQKLLHRPAALEYQSTRFDKDWQNEGNKSELTKVLEKAVEKTTATIKIPVPGRPGAFLQCKLMVLAAGGGCGFIANDDGSFVLLDDPATLSPEEDKQCQAWWDLIVSSKTQGEWRRTRTLYDKECRKPLLQQ
jgi:hypothetical protein